jgi:hypothetical protein
VLSFSSIVVTPREKEERIPIWSTVRDEIKSSPDKSGVAREKGRARLSWNPQDLI